MHLARYCRTRSSICKSSLQGQKESLVQVWMIMLARAQCCESGRVSCKVVILGNDSASFSAPTCPIWLPLKRSIFASPIRAKCWSGVDDAKCNSSQCWQRSTNLLFFVHGISSRTSPLFFFGGGCRGETEHLRK